jgi:Domain of unknown function (DUF4349)
MPDRMPPRLGLGPVTAGLIIAAVVLLSGCGGAGSTTASSGAAAPAGPAGQGNRAAVAPGAAGAAVPAGTGSSGQQENAGRVTRLARAGQDIVYTASMTVHVRDVGQQAARAAQIASNAGGYVSTEDAALRQGESGRPAASIQLKIPVAAYPAALRALAGLGHQTSLRQQAQDITLDVADTASRVASAEAAITQLRALLSRTGSVHSLLTVQQQINAQESALEALQSRQRALNHEVAYATVSLRLVGPVVAGHPARKHPKPADGFIGGLKAGWTALVAVVSWLLRTLGAVLPIGAACALAGYLAYRALRGRRWLRRKAG